MSEFGVDPDQPGTNIRLRPELAPRWMRPLIGGVQGAGTHADIARLDARGRTALKTRASDDRTAAVLVLLKGAEHLGSGLPEDAGVLLTHRSPSMRSHSGQIAFPGGKIDAGDISPVDAALREAWEETGLDRSSVTPLMHLEPIHIRATGYPVHPVVGHWREPSPVGVASPNEADDVFVAPLHELIDPKVRLMVGWSGWKGPAFVVNDYLVWGFTAGVLSALMAAAGWERPWERERVVDLQQALKNTRNNERVH